MTAKKTILVLDDDPSVRHMLQVLLEQDGHAVIAAGDVRSALAQCVVQLPDLMIVDLLSASTARNEIARRLGVEATLAKPFFAEDLRELVAVLTQDPETVAAG